MGFRRLLRAEWTKLRSVRRWVLGLFAATVLTVLVSLLAVSGSASDTNEIRDFVVGPDGGPVADDFRFVHQPLTGDGTIIARVAALEPRHARAAAGVMVKQGTTSGAPYAALGVTARHGVHLRANYTTDVAGDTRVLAPRWLKLVRAGTRVTGYESADGETWRRVGTVTVPGLPATVEIGLFVMSPPRVTVERQAGSTSVGEHATDSSATFDSVRLAPGPGTTWTGENVGRRAADRDRAGNGGTPGVFTVTGSGDIGPRMPDDDPVQNSLFGAFVGLMAVTAVGALFMTSEYRRGLIRTTFAATPKRGRVLAAKALVLAAAAFAAGLAGAMAAFLLGQPILRERGFGPPGYPVASLSDPSVLRAVLGTAALLAVVAVFSLAVGTVLRHSAAAITAVISLVVLPAIIAILLPTGPAQWLMRVTPAGGLGIQRSRPPTVALVEPWSMVHPWLGFGVLCGYTAVALALATWLLRRRDA